jgi:hypothetical protein
MVLTDAIAILAQVWTEVSASGLWDFAIAGAILGLVGLAFKMARKFSR